MSNAIERIVNLSFENVNVITFHYRGRPCWLASQVSEAAGYAKSSHINDKITGDWSNRFERGVHFDKIEGEDLRQAKHILEGVYPDTGLSLKYAPSMIVLYQEGVNLAMIKGDTDACYRVQRWLSDVVMKDIQTTGKYDPTKSLEASRADALKVAGFRLCQELIFSHPKIDKDLAYAQTLKAAKTNFGIDFEDFRLALPGKSVGGIPLCPRDLGKLIGKTAVQMNLLLAEHGLQTSHYDEVSGKKVWTPTDRGERHGEYKPYSAEHNGRHDYQWRWFERVLDSESLR